MKLSSPSELTLIAFLGPIGAGKGTQMQLLHEYLGWPTLSANVTIREKFLSGDKNDPVIMKARALYQSGELVTPSIVARWGKEKVTELLPDLKEGLLMEGFLRTKQEARLFLPFLIKIFSKKNIHVLFISISAEETLARNKKRRICSQCKKPAPIDLPAKTQICPYCGGKLIRRELDDPKLIRKRLQVFERDTKPALDYLKKAGVLVFINGEQKPRAVRDDILNTLKNITRHARYSKN